uniref:Uncharacterized protein n=1 Tax=Siphoviridae sp. ctYh54 TaxID=2826379 RepID=A0A8S5ME88_9CAUD|nr:MAG TPA: hypothetical protein [Siphoviridae sp. ctYh54]
MIQYALLLSSMLNKNISRITHTCSSLRVCSKRECSSAERFQIDEQIS